MHAHVLTMPLGEVVPHVVCPLPLPAVHSKCPRHLSDLQDQITVSSFCPHFPATDHFTSWLTPYGIEQMDAQSRLLPPEVIIWRCLIMTCCVVPSTFYVAGLLCFTKFCNDFSIPESDCMPAF